MYYLVNLLLFCTINNFAYHLVPYILEYNKNFTTLKYDKQKYVVKNVIKSANLFLLIYQTTQLVDCVIYNKPLTNSFVKNYASYYVANDMVALIKVKNLPKTTIFHHIMTTILLFVNYFIDYENLGPSSLAKLLIIYTCFSCYPFLVNTYLGLRFLEYKEEENNKLTLNQERFNSFLEFLRHSSYYIYLICIICNWSYQTFDLIINPFNINRAIYIMCMLPIINDDLVLLSWLKKKS
jgi:hypothetical protein